MVGRREKLEREREREREGEKTSKDMFNFLMASPGVGKKWCGNEKGEGRTSRIPLQTTYSNPKSPESAECRGGTVQEYLHACLTLTGRADPPRQTPFLLLRLDQQRLAKK